ncbi:MAG: hypothetical protein SGI92_08175 [Bryobacteraceae bacterium]|nr:hypothetical protein [Bryobacteraceae bacterium]
MEIQFNVDEFGRLMCELRDTDTHAIVTASDRHDAEQGLRNAVRSVQTTGNGECFWNEVSGQYRWVLRRFDELMLRVAVLWCSGTVTGWEHTFWVETPLHSFCESVEAGLAELTSPKSRP